MRFLRSAGLALSMGYVFFYFSELLFWARVRPEDSLPEWLWVWFTYSIATYVVLWLGWRFQTRSWWQVFLVGAAYGFIIEGIVVTKMYEAVPLSISFTPLAWHALISVMVGWWLVDRAVRRGQTRPFVWIGVAGGLAYGVWAINWWVEEDHQVTVASFATYSFAATVLVIPAYLVAARLMRRGFEPSVVGTRVVFGLVAFQYLVTGIFVTWLALVILPPLAYLTWRALARTGPELPPTEPLTIAFPTKVRQLVWFLAIPALATVVYTVAYGAGAEVETNIPVYLLLMPAGFVAYAWALVRALRSAGSVAV
ncbi:MAG: hypothetical protein JW722_00325 [Demequinaceae bacterium]|nr:hypothetical protein [Demequinaceae bacterium]